MQLTKERCVMATMRLTHLHHAELVVDQHLALFNVLERTALVRALRHRLFVVMPQL